MTITPLDSRAMNSYPGAVVRLVAYSGLHPRQPRRAALLHTNGGGPELFGWWTQMAASSDPSKRHIGAQYQVFLSGRSECYVDPALVVYHAFGASEWAFGIETEDDGNNATPWTPAQVQTIAAILHHHDVPAEFLVGPGPGDGIGYHQQQPAWNQSGHDCPGAVRRAQLPAVLDTLKALYQQTPTGAPDMTPQESAMLTKISQQLDRLMAERRTDHADVNPHETTLADVLNEVDALKQ